MPYHDDHFAILVGIKDYPHAPGNAQLQGPVKDVELFEKWLVAEDGGGVKPENVRRHISPLPSPPVPPVAQDYSPTPTDVEKELWSIVAPNGKFVRSQGRLYLYFSGHGFSNYGERINHACLYAGNARQGNSVNICGTKLAEWCFNAAAFQEIVLIMDCCRDMEMSKRAAEVNLDPIPTDSALIRAVKKMEIYAVSFDGKAQERFFPDLNETHGVLTYALKRALESAPLSSGGHRRGHEIKEFIEGSWGSLVGEQRIEAPQFVLPMSRDISFSEAPAKTFRRFAHFSQPLITPATLLVLDSQGVDVVRIDLDPAAGTLIRHTAEGASTLPFDGSKVELELLIPVCELVLKRDGFADASAFLETMGYADATIII